jgi:gamma-tubulin complex component 2
VQSPLTDEIIYSVTEAQYVEAIEKAYSFASQTLLDLLLKDYDLIGRLRYV